MKIFQGVPVFPGYVIGTLNVVAVGAIGVRKREIDATQVAEEFSRLDNALKAVQKGLLASQEAAERQLGSEYGKIFEAHSLILNDAKLGKRIRAKVQDELVSAEYAVDVVFTESAKILQGLQDAVYAERANDIVDVKDRLLRELLSSPVEENVESDGSVILATSNLKPSEAVRLDPKKIAAIVTEVGGFGSHTAIVASALGIPTILGLGSFLSDALHAKTAIVDGREGRLILDPDSALLGSYARKIGSEKNVKARLLAQKTDGETRTKPDANGASFPIEVKGNIELPSEAQTCAALGASVGLYRTEFLFLTNEDSGYLPDEETQFAAYKQVAETLKGRGVTIRTFDLGADKLPSGLKFTQEREANPFMGMRSLRLSLRNTDMFRVQLRALLRANAYGEGNISIMFPLVTTITEFRQAKMIFHDVCDELAESGVRFDPNVKLGIMVETPATAITLERFLPEVDFISVGTNDLLQYAMAVDRSNRDVSFLYEQEAPALLCFVKRILDVARMYGKPVSLCGQMGSEPRNVPLLIGLGLRSISVAPGMILEVKEACEAFTLNECEEIARKALQAEKAADVRMFLRNEMRKKGLGDASLWA